MSWIEAFILGLIQGLSEFLPISSSGHLELGKVILNVEAKESLTFTVVVHGATVLSTIIIFWKDIISIFKEVLEFKWNESTKYMVKIIISMIPVAIIGFFLQDEIKSLFSGNLLLVGSMLIVTAMLLAATVYSKPKDKSVSFLDSAIIGIAQAIAIIPGISRSGSTIATGLLLGNKKEAIARFSFLMVIIPIAGANLKDIFSGAPAAETTIGPLPLIVGFFAAFISGLIACKWMIKIVKNGNLIYFSLYCLLVGLIAITVHFLG